MLHNAAFPRGMVCNAKQIHADIIGRSFAWVLFSSWHSQNEQEAEGWKHWADKDIDCYQRSILLLHQNKYPCRVNMLKYLG